MVIKWNFYSYSTIQIGIKFSVRASLNLIVVPFDRDGR